MMKSRLTNVVKPFFRRFPLLELCARGMRDYWEEKTSRTRTTAHGFRFAGNDSMIDGSFEKSEVDIVKGFLKDRDVFIDIGANIGFYTCLALSLGKEAIAFEPCRKNLRYLLRNLMSNNWLSVEIFPVGLSDTVGMAPIYGDGTGASFISGWAGASKQIATVIPLSTLDILLGDRFNGKRLFIKIDVEGLESAVLQGAKNHLQFTPSPTWMVEINLSEHHPDELNQRFINTFEIFWEYGYQAFTADRQLTLISEHDIHRWYANRRTEFGNHNYIFMHA